MGKGHRGGVAVTKIGVDREAEGGDIGGGNGIGKGRTDPVISKAKKCHSITELLGVGDLHLPPLGAIEARDEPEVNAEATHSHDHPSPPPPLSLCDGVGIGVGVLRGDAVFDDNDDDDEVDDAKGEEDEGMGAPWDRQQDWIVQQGKEEKWKKTGVEVIYVPVEKWKKTGVEVIYVLVETVMAAVGLGRGRGRGIGGEVRRSKRIGAGLEDARHMLDGRLLTQGRELRRAGAGDGRGRMAASGRGTEGMVPGAEQGVGIRVLSSEGRGSIIGGPYNHRTEQRNE